MGKINDLKDQALATLRGKWGSFVGLTFIYLLLIALAQVLSQYGTIFQDLYAYKLQKLLQRCCCCYCCCCYRCQ